mmetsp:Transcript_7427/g.16764  ORF Transcript_7427/g.16764 Transcript_7427/m.16764 type:complete len:635 (+) Transcript_7427:212-2116(+)
MAAAVAKADKEQKKKKRKAPSETAAPKAKKQNLGKPRGPTTKKQPVGDTKQAAGAASEVSKPAGNSGPSKENTKRKNQNNTEAVKISKAGSSQQKEKKTAKDSASKKAKEGTSKKPKEGVLSKEVENGNKARSTTARKKKNSNETTAEQDKKTQEKTKLLGKDAGTKAETAAGDKDAKKKNKNGRKSKRRQRTKKDQEAKVVELTPEEAEKKAKLEAKREAKRAEKKKIKNKKNIQKARARKKAKRDPKPQDPSLMYFSNPLEAPIVKTAKKFFKPLLKGKPPFEVNLGPKGQWRVESKLAVRAGKDGIKIGLFLPKSHEILDYENCAVHHPAIDSAISKIRKAANALKVIGYNDETGEGQLRYLKMDVERAKSRVQLTLVWNAASEEAAGPSLKAFLARLKDMPIWHSIWVNFNAASKHVDRILEYDENSWKQYHGEESMIREELASVKLPYQQPRLCFPPTVFRQANLTAFEAIIASLREFVPEDSRVVEFYGGVGTIGLHLADKVQSLHCSDENPNNEKCFNTSCAELPEEIRSKLKYKPGAAATKLKQLKKADVLVVDPPRKGLEAEVLEALTGSDCPDLKTLLYVSCGFPALQRNLAALQASGWKLTHAAGYLLFPGADHLETFCVLNR